MRKRTAIHTPSVLSTAYPCGQVSITLLPGADLETELGFTVNRLGSDRIDGYPPHVLASTILTAVLWDDPVYELESRPKWADGNLLSVPIADVRQAGLALVAEIYSRQTIRLGIEPTALAAGVDKALAAKGESLPASGTASTS